MKNLLFFLSCLLVSIPLHAQKPSADNTGTTGELTASGGLDITEDGTVVENLSISGSINVQADNVIIRNCLIHGGATATDLDSGSFYGIQAHRGGKNLLIEDCEIRSVQSSCVIGSDFTIRRCHLWDSSGDAFKLTSNVLVESCFIEKLGFDPESHADGVQMVSGENVIVRGNTFNMPSIPGYNNSINLIIQTNNAPIDNITIDGNWLNGGGWTIQIRDKGRGHGAPTNISITNNIFGRDALFGPWVTDGDGTTITGNRWEDTGELLPNQSEASLKNISFAAPTTISPSGTDGAASSEAGDFNNDGDFEFISAATNSTSDAHFRIYDHNADGSFRVINILSDSIVQSRANRFGGDLTTADLNRDGWTDIIVPSSNNGNGSGTLTWFENPKDATLNSAWTERTIANWSGSEQVAHMSEVDVGDINGDGFLDIVTRDISHGVYILLQTPTATGAVPEWEPKIFIPTRSREGLDLFNPDGDNDLDIILNGIWLETPDDLVNGTFIEHTYGALWYPTGTSNNEVRDYAVQIAVADFNGDTRDDIAISNSEELNNSSSTDSKPKGIQLYLAPADPKTQSWTQIILEAEHFSWHSLEPADLDCDGDMDLLSAISTVGADNAGKELSYYLNNGDGTAFTKVTFSNTAFVYNSTLADADGDGDQDLFAPDSFNTGPMRYFENTSIPDDSSPTDTEAPSTPDNLVFANGVLGWDSSTDNTAVTSYRIFQNGSFLQNANTIRAVINASGNYTVSALDAAGNESAQSAPIAITVSSPPTTEDDSNIPLGLGSHWPLDDSVNDLTALNSGTLVNAPSFTSEGQIAGALRFNVIDQRVDLGNFNLSGSALTISTWVKIANYDAATKSTEARFISKASASGEQDHIWMLGTNPGGAVRFRLKTGTTTTLVTATGVLPIDEWHHIAATYDGTQMRIFLDGIQVAQTNKSGTIASSTAPVALGNQPTGETRPLDGFLDDVRIYNRALIAPELTSVSNPSPFSLWRQDYYTTPDDNDGLNLLLEYALGTDPGTFQSSPLTTQLNGQAISIQYLKMRSELTYLIEVSYNLSTWDDESIDQGTAPFGSMETATITPPTSEPQTFLRLRVSE